MIHDPNCDRILTSLQNIGGYWVISNRVVMTRDLVAANSFAVDPGHIHVVDLAEAERGFWRFCLLGGECDGFAKPDHAVETWQPGVFEMARQRHRLPGLVVEIRLRPRFLLRARIRRCDSRRPIEIDLGSC